MKKRVIFLFFFLLGFGFIVFRFIQVVKPFQGLGSSYLSPQVEGQSDQEAGERLLFFSVMGDPENDLDNLEKALVKSKELKSEFVVIVGDLSSTGTAKEFKEIKKVLGETEAYLIPGNHDLWYEKEEGVKIWEQYFGQRYYAEEIKGYQFIFLDNSDEWLGFDQTQLNWLGHFLFAADAFKAGQLEHKYLVFTHIPFWHPESQKAMGEYGEGLKDQAYQLLQEFCHQPPLVLFSGHLHKTSDYLYGCSNGKQIRMVNAGSLHKTRNLQLPRFLQVKIYLSGEMEIEEIELDS